MTGKSSVTNVALVVGSGYQQVTKTPLKVDVVYSGLLPALDIILHNLLINKVDNFGFCLNVL